MILHERIVKQETTFDFSKKITIIEKIQNGKNMENQKGTKLAIACCKICGNQEYISRNYTKDTINCRICGNEIPKKEWQMIKSD